MIFCPACSVEVPETLGSCPSCGESLETGVDPGSNPVELPATETVASEAVAGGQIGPYRLLEKLGEGGMGEVWLAEQTEPVRRTVALKVVKQGMDTRQVVARFEAERQALALMDHPAIAKVYHAGSTPQGRPYFAMEHVKGVPITEHCDRHKLTNRERLDLFMRVCAGVQHAHHKAVIHRDLKPGNVLVSMQDDRPQPKIIDFGVAKATAQKLTEQTMHTRLGTMLGTPVYMSPEQADPTVQDIDTRTDVYALGVMLYELLVGVLPFDLKEFREAGFEGMVRRIREQDPPKPSTRFSTLGDDPSTASARCRRTEVLTLKRELSGDLDWITMKALEKERTRRYSSPQELAADIERYLEDEPVLASPPSMTYRARKFVRRHTWGVAVASIGLLLLVVFAATMAVQARRIAAQRDDAERARGNLESVVGFQVQMLSRSDYTTMGRRLIADLFAQVEKARRARGASDAEVTAALSALDDLVGEVNATDLAMNLVDEDVLARAVATLDREFGDRPLIDADLRQTIGEVYRMLGRYEKAEPQLEAALETRQRVLGDSHRDTLDAMSNLAILYEDQARFDEAEPLYLAALEGFRGLYGEEGRATLTLMNNLAGLYRELGRYDEAEGLYSDALEARKRVLGPEHKETLRSMNGLAILYSDLERFDEAEALYVETLEIRRRVLGDEHPDTLGSMNNLAILYDNQKRFDESEPLYLETLAARRRSLGDEHPLTLDSINNLAVLYHQRRRLAEAEALYLQALAARRRVLGVDHPSALDSLNNLGVLYMDLGRENDAEAVNMESYERHRRVRGADHPDTLSAMANLAQLYRDQDRDAEHEWIQAAAFFAQGELAAAVERQRNAVQWLPAGSPLLAGYEKTLAEYEKALKDGENP